MDRNEHPIWIDTLIERLVQLAQDRSDEEFDKRVDDRIDRKLDKLKLWVVGLAGAQIIPFLVVALTGASMLTDIQNDINEGQENDEQMVTQTERAADLAAQQLRNEQMTQRLDKVERKVGMDGGSK
jgi:uncharacterized protein YdbL (DUF1318 family)